MKRVISLLIIVCVLFALTGCEYPEYQKISFKIVDDENVEVSILQAVEKAAETTRKARRKKPTEIWVQAQLGGEISVDEVLARVREAAGEPDSVYIKAEENKAFYVAGGKTGYVELWK